MDRSYRGRNPQRHGGGGGGGGNKRGGHQAKVLPPMQTYLDRHTLVILSKGASSAQTKDIKQPDSAHPLRLSGVLRGFDMYNNLVLENAVDESHPGIKTELGETIVIRGEHVHSIELIVKPFEFKGYGGESVGIPV